MNKEPTHRWWVLKGEKSRMNWAWTKIKNRIKLSLTEKNNYTNERSYLVRKLDSWSKQVRTGPLGRSEGGEYGNKINHLQKR